MTPLHLPHLARPARPALPPVATLAWALGLASLLLAGCHDAPLPDAAPPAPIVQGRLLRFAQGHPQLALLDVSAAAPGKAIAVELPARLVWNEERTQRIYPAFAGRVTRIVSDVGQRVHPGSTLAQLASPDFGTAQADTAKAQADAQLMQKTLVRQRELFAAGIVARKDLEQSEADAARTQAEVQRAAARTALYGGGTGVNQQLALSASIQGVVVERNLNPGQEVRPDQSGPGVPALFVVTDPTSLWVQIDARESEASTLRVGAHFSLAVPSLPGRVFDGQVTAVADAIDPASRTLKIRGVVDNPERLLKAEMLATARIQRQLGAGVLVPAAAVLLHGTTHSVYVQLQPGVFERREVQLSYQGPHQAVVSRGLEVGEQVVSSNALLLARVYQAAQDDAAPSKSAALEQNQPTASINISSTATNSVATTNPGEAR